MYELREKCEMGMTRDEICNGLQEILNEAYCLWVNRQYTRDKLIIDIGTYVGEAIKLLKEQQPVNDTHGSTCPRCLLWVQRSYSYCPFCGKAMKWDDK